MRLSTFEKHLGIKLHIFHTGIGLVRISLVGSTFTTLPKHKISPNINNFEYTFTVTYINVINIFQHSKWNSLNVQFSETWYPPKNLPIL